MTIDFSDLETPVDKLPVRDNQPDRPTFPCIRCNGTGKYTFGYVNRQTGDCHACKGRGFFLTSPNDRRKSREARADREAAKKLENWEDFKKRQPAAADWLECNRQKNDFASDLYDGVLKYGDLTDNQLAAVIKGVAREDEWARERAEANKNRPVLDLAPVKKKFDAAVASGIKAPKLRLDGFCFTRAKDCSANPGFIYIKESPAFESTYYGKVAPDGTFTKAYGCTPEVQEALIAITQDVLAAAKAYGQKTGTCSCCGRTLTNALSIKLGIGPICREAWGMGSYLDDEEDPGQEESPEWLRHVAGTLTVPKAFRAMNRSDCE